MKACGLIVEYNPFHHGHAYHVREAKKASDADCMIAVMSGSFLQRGEPAIIDKFHRTRAALASGIDIVLELPYIYAVQSSDLFAKGAVQTLFNAGASSICFGSESGNITDFTDGYHLYKERQGIYNAVLQKQLKQGQSYPEAGRKAYEFIGLGDAAVNLTQPNNILGFSYIKEIIGHCIPVKPLTIQRIKNHYHDETITDNIASATSIRKQLLATCSISPDTARTIPEETKKQLERYKTISAHWHQWEHYFPLIHYRVLTMTNEELAAIQGVDEGLEHRLKKTARAAASFSGWMEAMKTKRYTWTRLQRMFVHILTNTKKAELAQAVQGDTVPYLRLLGLNKTGKAYLNSEKKKMHIPIITAFSRKTQGTAASLEERASRAYYSIVPPEQQEKLFKQELQLPIIL
jgi:predicted nucleotidyltransferase